MTVRLAAYLSYSDASAAITWLAALGFSVVARDDASDGSVLHAELRLGDAVVMLASHDRNYLPAPVVGQSTGAGLYLATEDVDRLYQAAVDAGGTSLIAPENTGWGSRRARVLDIGGREWSFGTYEPGQTS